MRFLCVIGAFAFILLGLAGWIIPVISGIPFYGVALVLLGLASKRVGGWVNRTERRLPHAIRLKLRSALRRLPSPRLRRLFRVAED